MLPIRLLIVDDEPLAIEVLENYIARFPQQLKLVTTCNNAVQAFDAINTHQIDLMFLDIEMPQISGIDFLKSLAKPPKVVFTTAYPQYALDGYDLNIVDYLLKPIALDRFEKAVDKAIFQLEGVHLKAQKELSEKNPAPMTQDSDKPDYIFVKADKKLIKLKFEDILFVEGLKDYVMIYTPSGRIITLQTMKSLEEKLPSDLFMRVHRSYIVGSKHIAMLQSNTIYIDSKEIPIGKNYKDEVTAALNKNRL